MIRKRPRINGPQRVGHMAVARLLATLTDGPATVADLVNATGLHRNSVSGYLTAFRRLRLVYLAEWSESSIPGKNRAAAYALGDRRDAPRPAPKCPALIDREYRARQKMAAALNLKRTA